jgi:hypothetical protein
VRAGSVSRAARPTSTPPAEAGGELMSKQATTVESWPW